MTERRRGATVVLLLDVLTASPAVIGASWTASVVPRADRTTAPAGLGVAVILLRKEGPPASPVIVDLAPLLVGGGSAPLSELLITGELYLAGTVPHAGGGVPSATFSAPVPLRTALLCAPWFAQAVVLGDLPGDGVTDLDLAFSTAVSGTVGAQ